MFNLLAALLQPALSIRSIDVAPALPDPDDREATLLQVTAVPSGLLAALKRLVGLGRTTTFSVGMDRVLRHDHGSSGSDFSTAPLSRVASLHYGSHKPIGMLLVAVIVMILGFGSFISSWDGTPGMVMMAVGVAFLFAYFLGKSTYGIILATTGGTAIGIRLLTGNPLELDQACNLIQAALVGSVSPARDADERTRAA